MVSLPSLSLENLLAQRSPLIVENSFLVNPSSPPPTHIDEKLLAVPQLGSYKV